MLGLSREGALVYLKYWTLGLRPLMVYPKVLLVHLQGDAYIAPAANTTAARIVAIAEHLRAAAPAATVLLLGLLPRGDQTLMPSPAMLAQPSKCVPANPRQGLNPKP